MNTRVVLLAVVVTALCGSSRVSATSAVEGHGGEPEQQQQQQAVLSAGKEKGAFQARLHEEDLAAEKEAAAGTPEKKAPATLKEHFAELASKHAASSQKLESEHEKSGNADKRGFAKSAKKIAGEHEATVTNCDDSLITIDADGLKKVAAGCAKAAGAGEGGAFLEEESHEASLKIEKKAQLRSLSKNIFSVTPWMARATLAKNLGLKIENINLNNMPRTVGQNQHVEDEQAGGALRGGLQTR